ncbi:hypothetical protein Drorol1_Dr00025008 [Drosera rotundifolia]
MSRWINIICTVQISAKSTFSRALLLPLLSFSFLLLLSGPASAAVLIAAAAALPLPLPRPKQWLEFRNSSTQGDRSLYLCMILKVIDVGSFRDQEKEFTMVDYLYGVWLSLQFPTQSSRKR